MKFKNALYVKYCYFTKKNYYFSFYRHRRKDKNILEKKREKRKKNLQICRSVIHKHICISNRTKTLKQLRLNYK